MPKATVLEYSEEKGFGKLRLDDTGEEMSFDVSACNKLIIKAGESGEVTLGTSRVTGKPKVKMLVFADGDKVK